MGSDHDPDDMPPPPGTPPDDDSDAEPAAVGDADATASVRGDSGEDPHAMAPAPEPEPSTPPPDRGSLRERGGAPKYDGSLVFTMPDPAQLETRKGTSGAAIVQDLVNCALELTEDQIAEFKECFALFDEDGSGTVDCAELGNVMKSLGQKMTDEELQTMITYVDADGSGTVDFAEFLGMMARQMKDHDSDLVLQRSFDLLDTGGTGRVSKGNLCYVLGVLCDKMTSAEIEELVDEAVRAGGTNDEALGFTQFMNIMKITASTGTDRTAELQRMVSSRANLALN